MVDTARVQGTNVWQSNSRVTRFKLLITLINSNMYRKITNNENICKYRREANDAGNYVCLQALSLVGYA